MAINLHEKFSTKVAQAFRKNSLFEGRFSDDYEFSGVKTVKVSTIQTVPLVNYTRSGTNRYGSPVEVQDIIQEMQMTQDRSFALTVDKGNNEEQSRIKNAAKVLGLEVKEQAIPEKDLYTATKLVQMAGKVYSGAAPTKSTIAERISDGTEWLDDAEVPESGRTLFISAACYKMLKLSPEFLGIQDLGKKALAKGQVGEYDGMPVIKVPKSRLLKGTHFIIAHKDAVVAPVKLDDTKLHVDPPGISGNLMEGRFLYDVFVKGANCDGVYADVLSTDLALATTPTITITSHSATISGGVGATIYYTVDGSDPRYSNSAAVYSAAITTTAGVTVKAYAVESGKLNSAVASETDA